jgi:CRISPR-associated protein Cas5t
MFLFSIKGHATTASFRVPETHTFHKTLPLPPKTTIIGMLGAAFGLNLEDAHEYAEQNEILIGVYGTHKGMMKDLWNYKKIKRNECISSILIREYLYNNDFVISFGSQNKEPLEKLRTAFLLPVYPITAGNSDDLLKIIRITDISTAESESLSQFEHTVLPGDISESCKFDIDFDKLPITQTVYTPQVFRLPTKFTFDGNERRVAERRPFTFISSSVNVETPIEGYIVEGKNIVLQ